MPANLNGCRAGGSTVAAVTWRGTSRPTTPQVLDAGLHVAVVEVPLRDLAVSLERNGLIALLLDRPGPPVVHLLGLGVAFVDVLLDRRAERVGGLVDEAGLQKRPAEHDGRVVAELGVLPHLLEHRD